MKIYHLDCSVNDLNHSLTRKYSKMIVDRLSVDSNELKITYIDLAKEKLPFITKDYQNGMFKMPEERSEKEKEALEAFDLQSFVDADVYVLGVPGYLFNVPATFKNWLEHLFRFDSTLTPEWDGLLYGKTMYVVSAWGGAYTNTDIEHYFEYIIRKSFNMFGVKDITFFNIYRDEETSSTNVKEIEEAIEKAV